MQDVSASGALGSRSAAEVEPRPFEQVKAPLQQWFLQEALPTWFAKGVDWRGGGFFERLNDQAEPLDEPRRTRVVARQIYVFGVAHRLGWTGRAQEAMAHGLNFLLGKQRQSDGLFASSVDLNGAVVNAHFDLYEQAFALFALAQASTVLTDRQAELRAQADATLDTLLARFKHPARGFEETMPPSAPLRSNPHMHLFEATLAWEAQHPQGSRWHELSDELAALALQCLIDPRTGALYELFDLAWRPLEAPGQCVVEPGHQFEWAWLLLRWGTARQRADALVAGRRLIAIGHGHGICPQRQVAVNALDGQLAVTDAQAKLWPQTEWIKAAHTLSLAATQPAEQAQAQADAARAIAALLPYLQHPVPGMWREVMRPDGSFSTEPCRASSLYHIVCAIDTLTSTPFEFAQRPQDHTLSRDLK
jgi:mannose/cellobiose epimerase-like protein (N-acyl-D-glucosamine 2-epimerase family)